MNTRNAALAAGLGGLGAGLGGIFGGGHDPYKAANKYFGQIPQTITPFYQPYVNAGQTALGQLQGQYGALLNNLPGIQGQFNQLINDPNSIMNKFGQGYQRSPGYDWQLSQGLNAANNAAAAGGMIGTPQHQQQAAQVAEGLANQDYYNYLNHALGLYGQGLQGDLGLYGSGLTGEQGLNTLGYGASSELGQDLANSLMTQGNLKYSGTAAQNQSRGSSWGDILGGIGTLAAFL